MEFSFLVNLSIRNLYRHSRRTLILLLAIVVAIAGVVIANALLRGMQDDIRRQVITNLNGHFKIHRSDYLANPSIKRGFVFSPDWVPYLGDANIDGWAARVRVPASIMSERETRGVELIGVNPSSERISFLSAVEFDGVFLADSRDRGVIIGRALARQLKTRVGKRLVLVSEGGDGLAREAGFRIVGIYDADSELNEKRFVFSGLETVQQFLGTAFITEISIKTFSQDLRNLKGTLSSYFSPLQILDWQELEPQTAAMVGYVDFGVLILFVIIMGALMFGLVNAFVTSVMERVREFGVLRALGMAGHIVVIQVILESMLITAVGLVFGVAGGWLIASWLSKGIDLSEWSEGVEVVGMSSVLYPNIIMEDIVLVIGLTLIFGLLSSAYPAWKAIQIKALDAIGR